MQMNTNPAQFVNSVQIHWQNAIHAILMQHYALPVILASI